MKKDGLKRWIKQPETAGKRPNPWVIWVLVGAIAILALSGLFDGKKQKNTQTAARLRVFCADTKNSQKGHRIL